MYVAEYLLSTVYDCLAIKPSSENIVIRDYTDASFDVHPDLKSHSGLCVNVGESGCAMFSPSIKQYCMTRSSTDVKIVAAMAGLYICDYYRDVLDELGIDSIVVQLQVNPACINLVEDWHAGL